MPFASHRFRLLLVAAATFFSALPASAQLGSARIPVREVAGRLVVECDISTSQRRIPVNLFLDLETACGLQLHNKAANPLGTETEAGERRPITIHFPQLEIVIPEREHGDEKELDRFTKYYAKEMGENAVVGTIGAQVFKDYDLVFDLGQNYFSLTEAEAPEGPSSLEPPPGPPGSIRLRCTFDHDLVWLPLQMRDGRVRAIALGSGRYESILDRDLAFAWDAPAGRIGSLKLGSLELSDFLALRPEEMPYVHPDRAVGILGIDFLKHVRVQVQRKEGWVELQPRKLPPFPEEDLAYYQVRLGEDGDDLEQYLRDWPEARLSREAAEQLLWIRVDEGGSGEQVLFAVKRFLSSQAEDLQATLALDLMKAFAEDGWPEYQLLAGEEGLEGGRTDRYPNAVHEIHGQLGEVHLKQGHEEEAWRHLLSAAFGKPEDGMINLHLGQFYESQGRYRRAFSRFLQAAIKPESGPQAVEAMNRVQPLMGDGEAFSVDLVERMIAGKVLNYGDANEYEPDPETVTNRITLIEYFTNASIGDEKGGSIAGGMAWEALRGHFSTEYCAFLAYHLEEGALEPLVNGDSMSLAAAREVSNPDRFLVNGMHAYPAIAKYRDRESVYLPVKDGVVDSLQQSAPWELRVEDMRLEEGILRGTIVVEMVEDSAPQRRRLHVTLAERGVLFPSASGVVIHRMVARAALTPSIGGVWTEFDQGIFRYDFEADLDSVGGRNEAYLREAIREGRGLTHVMSTRMDPNQLSVVAYLRDSFSGEIAQAVQADFEGPKP